MNWLLDHVPLILLFAAAIAGGIVTYRLGGLKGLVAFGALVGAALLYRDGRQTGKADSQAEGRRDAQRTVSTAERARVDADRRNADPERLRDDDGFRRD